VKIAVKIAQFHQDGEKQWKEERYLEKPGDESDCMGDAQAQPWKKPKEVKGDDAKKLSFGE
jgi:hypothetical protein